MKNLASCLLSSPWLIIPLLYSVKFWLNMLGSNRGCLCVCLSVRACVCVCVCHLYSPNGLVDFDETFHKWSWRYLPVTFFTDFENSKWMTSWRPFCTFFIPALSRSQFCSDFLQNWAQGTKLSSNVCYWKSAKSVGNFRKYREPRFRKKIKMATKFLFLFFEIGQVRCRFPLIQTYWSRIW